MKVTHFWELLASMFSKPSHISVFFLHRLSTALLLLCSCSWLQCFLHKLNTALLLLCSFLHRAAIPYIDKNTDLELAARQCMPLYWSHSTIKPDNCTFWFTAQLLTTAWCWISQTFTFANTAPSVILTAVMTLFSATLILPITSTTCAETVTRLPNISGLWISSRLTCTPFPT